MKSNHACMSAFESKPIIINKCLMGQVYPPPNVVEHLMRPYMVMTKMHPYHVSH